MAFAVALPIVLLPGAVNAADSSSTIDEDWGLFPGGSAAAEAANEVFAARPYLRTTSRMGLGQPTKEGDNTIVNLGTVQADGSFAGAGAAGEGIELVLVDAGTPVESGTASSSIEFDHETNDASTLVQGTDGGARAVVVLENEQAPTRYDYRARRNGVDLTFMRDASSDGVLVGTGDESEFQAFGSIAAPWAVDSAGLDIPVGYEISDDGQTLSMQISPSDDAAFPVTADPRWRFWRGVIDCSWGSCTFYLERKTTYQLRNYFNTNSWSRISNIVNAIVCGAIGGAIGIANVIAGVISGIVCAWYVNEVWIRLKDKANQGASCLTFKKYHWESPTLFLRWDRINSKWHTDSRCYYDA